MKFWKAGFNMTILFDLDIYSIDAVRQAVKDYASMASIDIQIKDPMCICHITHTRYDTQTTCDEFTNYVLDLTVSQENSQP